MTSKQEQQSHNLLKLCLVPGLGAKRIAKIIERKLDLEKIATYSDETFYELGFPKKVVSDLKNLSLEKNLKKEIQILTQKNIQTLSFFDKNYPALLKEIYDPPPLFFYQGSIPNDEHFFVAFVGSRKSSNYGKSHTRKIIQELSERYDKTVIVSGLAYGIDAVAHQAALDFGLKTIAVLGSGLGNIYPKANSSLAQKILKQEGALISEFLTLIGPQPQHFPQRNRIINGLSSAVVVMEAGLKSGALITANYAVKENREVFALPGNIDSESYQGCNSLIKRGAHLISSAEDVLETFALQKFLPSILGTKNKTKKNIVFEKQEQKILDFLKKQPAAIEEMVNFLKISLPEVMQYTTSLELKGAVREEAGGRYYSTY